MQPSCHLCRAFFAQTKWIHNKGPLTQFSMTDVNRRCSFSKSFADVEGSASKGFLVDMDFQNSPTIASIRFNDSAFGMSVLQTSLD